MVKLRIHERIWPGDNFLLSLLTVFYLFITAHPSEQVPVIPDKSNISISLKDYNVNDPNGESIEGKYLLKPNSSCEIHVTAIPEDVHFVVVQAHSFLNNITLSSDEKMSMGNSVTGTNVGLLKFNTAGVLIFHLLSNPFEEVIVMIAAQAYGINAPIPGGCNMEFQVEISPFMKVVFDEAITKVDFAPAAPSLPFISSPSITTSNLCNIKPSPVNYKMYRHYLPERNFSEELYFSTLKKMMTKKEIMQHGQSIPDKYGASPMRYSFASYPGTGSFFTVVAETQDGSSVYVPSFTYSCHIDRDGNDCKLLTTTFSKLLCAAVFFLGLFACFAAHRFFKIELFLLGFLSGGVLSYIAAKNLHSPVPLHLSIVTGLICGTASIIVWCFRGLPLFSLISATFILGYLTASCIFYKLVDVFTALESDINYWVVFSSIVLLAPILMISLSEKANIISCSIVGSYASVLAVDYYIGSNLRFIVINILRRATIPRFKYAIIDPPFQTKDLVLTLAWILLGVAGITVQLLLMQGRAPYPAPSNPFTKVFDRLGSLRQRSSKIPNETTPLLHSGA